uniref:Caspase family p20 domain-containing protein n=1 Tax=Homalodisca liturata TaxID=320908 RepID=A0A1B6HU18_9HEMI
MMNHTSASDRDSSMRPDNTYDPNDQNVNRLESFTMSQETTEYTEYNPNILLENYNDNDAYNDDEVFEEFQETTVVTVREPRIRRISDVIDSIGCSPSSPISKNGTFDFTEKTVTETEESSISIVRREEFKYISLQNPPPGRALHSVTDSILSPPTTPCSDGGYCSGAGLQSPTSTLVCKPKWFRFSSSSFELPASPPKLDMMDAQVMCQPKDEQPVPMEATTPSVSEGGGGVTPLVYPKAPMPVEEKHSMEYNTSHPKIGHAVILNHEEFAIENTPTRHGSKLDANRLGKTLASLGFSVDIHHDLDSEKIRSKIKDLAELNHSDCDCVLVAVLSHGMGTSYILARDYPYPVDMLWSPFTPDRCPTLAGKPKIFLIQACRGDKLDGGVQLVRRSQVDSDSGQTYKIPAMADFLIAYSTAEGFYSWRNPQKGTWFIQSLCDVLEQEANSHDLYTLLLMVAQKVALDHESFSDLYPWQHQQKQVPQTVSTLIRKFFFKKKP